MQTSSRPPGALNAELRAQLEGFGLPEPVLRTIAGANEEVERSGLAAGLAVGDPAVEFVLPGADGRAVRLSGRLASGPVVLSFYRGAWCPFCNLELRALQAALPMISAAGASLMAVSQQAPEAAAGLVERHQLGFDVLSDLDGAVARAWRLRFAVSAELRALYENVFGLDLAKENADGSWSLVVPATFVLDGEGVVRARYVQTDYTTRMEPEAIVAALAAMATPSTRR